MSSKQLSTLSKQYKARVGLYTCGLNAYWNQFEGLRQRIIDYGCFIEQRISNIGGELYNFGLVDDVASGRRAGEWFNSKNVDIVFCHVGTYFTSSVILPIHQICHKPVIILNLQPAAKMNYEKTSTGEWLAHCNACPIPEISNMCNRAKINFKCINGLLGLSSTPAISLADEVTNTRDEAKKSWKEIKEWVDAARVQRTLQFSTFGFLGNTYSGMLDMYSDITLTQAQTGIHVEMLEMCDLHHYIDRVTEEEVNCKLAQINNFFEISGDSPSDPIARAPSADQLKWSAKIAVAQEYLVNAHELDALVYYYHGLDDNVYEKIQSGFIVGHSLLTARGIPCSGEGDLKTGIAMKICDTLGIGGSYSEIVGVDYDTQTIIMGHDGPFHIKIANSKPKLRGMEVYHGKKGRGVSVEANVLNGDVTTLGITQTREDGLKMIVGEGLSIDHPILMIGNTETHVDFYQRPDVYMDQWFVESPTHHCAIAIGHHSQVLEKLAYLMNIRHVRIGPVK